jgi:cytochrome c-type biogenesis protein CcmH/NrfG
MKNKEAIIFAGIALIVGVLIGFMIGSKTGGGSNTAQVRPPTAAPPAATINPQQDIKRLEEVVAREPDNRNAWVQLGNTFFDAQQPMKSIEAYQKALDLDGNDPNVLTDQGVMFRRLGWYDRALQNFEKAAEISPDHPQSYYNLGIVYRYDLQDFPKAVEAWEKFLALNPAGAGAEQVRQEMDFLKTHPPMQGGAPGMK